MSENPKDTVEILCCSFLVKIMFSTVLESRRQAPVICKNRDVATLFYASES